MKIKNRLSTIKITSVLVILMCVLCGFMGITNSWFTESGKQINILINVGNINFNIYQGDRKIESNESSYITLNQTIVPDVNNVLNLTLKNENMATNSYYIRYKIEFYVRNVSEDIKLENVSISGYTMANAVNNGFFNGGDGWFYYGNQSNVQQTYAKNTVSTLIGGFVVPYSEYLDGNLNPKFNCEDLKIVLSLEGSQTAFIGG